MVPSGVNPSLRRVGPLRAFAQAEGAIVTDVNGSEGIDYHAALGPAILPHNDPAVNTRLKTLDRFGLLDAGATNLEAGLVRHICGCVPSAEKGMLWRKAALQSLRIGPIHWIEPGWTSLGLNKGTIASTPRERFRRISL